MGLLLYGVLMVDYLRKEPFLDARHIYMEERSPVWDLPLHKTRTCRFFGLGLSSGSSTDIQRQKES
jgi:hypothetical protein